MRFLRQNFSVRRTSSRSGNKATLPKRSRETLPLAEFSFGVFDAAVRAVERSHDASIARE